MLKSTEVWIFTRLKGTRQDGLYFGEAVCSYFVLHPIPSGVMNFSASVRRRLWDRYGEDRVRRAVEQAIEAEGLPKNDAQRVHADLRAWLGDDAEVAEFMDLPIGEVIVRISEGLGLALDWDIWSGQIWAINYVGMEVAGSLYALMRAQAVATSLLRRLNGPPASAPKPR